MAEFTIRKQTGEAPEPGTREAALARLTLPDTGPQGRQIYQNPSERTLSIAIEFTRFLDENCRRGKTLMTKRSDLIGALTLWWRRQPDLGPVPSRQVIGRALLLNDLERYTSNSVPYYLGVELL
ncbi:hypothetical protein [Gordonia alkaliphila]|uniref:Integrase n=1 Tax=Gordonia alkaliphila TaxID=1053547 RepID=A0ABP8ZGD7_9ACTN